MADLTNAFEGRHGQQITKGELEIRSDFMPILNSPRWHGSRHAMAARLAPDAGKASPWIALGLVVGKAYAYPPPETANVMEEYHDLLVPALEHLKNRANPPRWQLASDRSAVQVLMRQGDELTASDVLDRSVVRQAADLLQCEEVMIALPSRRVMLAYAPGTEAAAEPLIVKYFEDAQHRREEPLTPHSFRYLGGRLEYMVLPEAEPDLALAPEPEPSLDQQSASEVFLEDKPAMPPRSSGDVAAARQQRMLLIGGVVAVGLLVVILVIANLGRTSAPSASTSAPPATATTVSPGAAPAEPVVQPDARAPDEVVMQPAVTAKATIGEPVQELKVGHDVPTGPAAGVRLWRAKIGQPVRAMTLSGDQNLLFVREDSRMTVLELGSRRSVRQFHGVFGVMSADGLYAATRADQVQTVHIFQIADGQMIASLKPPGGTWTDSILAPGGRLLICVGKKVTALSPDREKPVWNLFLDDISSLALSPQGQRLVLLRPSGLMTLRVDNGYKLAGASLEKPLTGPVCFPALSTIVAGDRARILIYAEDLSLERQIPIPRDAKLLAAAQGGNLLAIATAHDVLVVSGNDGRPLARVPHPGKVDHAILLENERLLTVTEGDTLTYWDVSVRQ